MTKDEIIEMARQAGFRYTGNFSVDKGESLSCFQADLEAFAKLVEAKEREACALVADHHAAIESRGVNNVMLRAIAGSIRARGEA